MLSVGVAMVVSGEVGAALLGAEFGSTVDFVIGLSVDPPERQGTSTETSSASCEERKSAFSAGRTERKGGDYLNSPPCAVGQMGQNIPGALYRLQNEKVGWFRPSIGHHQ